MDNTSGNAPAPAADGEGTRKVIFSVVALAAAFGYAIVRYNVIKGTPWEQLPLFITNKATALAAVIFIALSYIPGPLARFWPGHFSHWLPMRKYFGLAGFGLGMVHAVMSLLLFTPAYYPKFFTAKGALNLTGELSMLFGVLGAAIFALVAVTSIPSVEKGMEFARWQRIQRLGYWAFLLIMLHVLVMGFAGWLTPATWPGGLLPISLVAFIIIAFTLLLRIGAIFVRRA